MMDRGGRRDETGNLLRAGAGPWVNGVAAYRSRKENDMRLAWLSTPATRAAARGSGRSGTKAGSAVWAAVVVVAATCGCSARPAVGAAASDALAGAGSQDAIPGALLDAPADSQDVGAAAPADAAADGTDDGGAGTESTTCPRVGGAPSAQLQVLFATIIKPGCVGAGRFCHGEMYAFDMRTPEETIANLVNVRGCAGIRVVPCRPDQSSVASVIRHGGEPCGRPLVVNSRHPTFSDAEVASIEDWIRMGAQ